MPLITTSSALNEACARLARHPFVTVDTEFMRESTYYPKLCLIQLASPDDVYLVDPLADGIVLDDFLALMRNPNIVKVFHSGRQDLEILWHMDQCIPAPVFDTQVVAMVCGYGDSVSYEQLAHDLAKARIDKMTSDSMIDFHYLDLISYRLLSNKVSEHFNVYHESPQVLLIKDGACIYDESHLSIYPEEIILASK